MTKFTSLSIAIGLLIFTDCNGRRTVMGADDEPLRQRTDRLVQPYLDNDIVVGMTIGILRDGKQEVFGYGKMSRDDRRVPDGDTIYELGSATKVLTGILLADAVVQGRVKLDQPAGELLPAGVQMPVNGDRAITLQDLSTHVSGLPRIPDNMKFGDLSNPYADYGTEELYAFLNDHELAQAPGEKSEYSNLGQGLLGHLLSVQAKSTYEDLVRDRIAVPLKMNSTRITLDKELQSRLAPGHLGDGGSAANWDMSVLAGAGGVRTTVNDLMLFAAANLEPSKDKLGEAMEMAWSVHQKPIKKGDGSVGLGWQAKPDGTRWHNGQTGGYHSMILINRTIKSSVVLLTNTSTGEVDRLAMDIMKMISGKQVAVREFKKPVAVPADTLQKFVGRYEINPDAALTVEVTDGKLMVGMTGQPSFEVFARSETEWFYKVVDATLTFHLDKDGNCDSLVLLQAGVKLTGQRKKDAAKAIKKDEKVVEVPAETLQKFAGSYAINPGAVFTVKVEDEKLMIKLTGQSFLQVFPRSETEWFYKVVDASITFNLDKDGKCDSLVVLQNGVKQTAKRKKVAAEATKKEEKAIDVPAEALEKLVGTYELAPGAVFTVEADEGKLMISLTGQPSLQVHPRSQRVWFYKEVDATITFNIDNKGKCNSLVLNQNGKKQTAKRKK